MMNYRKLVRLLSAVLCAVLLIGALPISAIVDITDTDVRNNTSTASIGYAEGIENINVHTAEEDGYHFLLGASIIKFGDVWVCAYGQSLEKENDANTRFACKYSYDNCKTWSDEVVIADTEGEYSRGHGVLYNDGETLWAFCPKAKYNGTDVFENLDFTMEAYTLSLETMTWTLQGTACDDGFWPLCEPIALSNGTLLIAGLECDSGTDQAAVAIADADDPMNFEMIVIPNESEIKLWGETTVVDYGDRLVAYVRTRSSGVAAVSESTDFGRTWSSLALSDMEVSGSKMYGGTLSTGSRYLIYNYGGTREKLVIAIGNPDGSYGFHNIYLIKSGYEKQSQFGFSKQWAYPYAVEEDGYLYVVYAENKEDCELSIIPISSLTYSEQAKVDVYEVGDNRRPTDFPEYETIAELVDTNEQVWWSGDGTDGIGNISYTTIDGVPVVARLHDTGMKNQILRRTFDVDLSGEDYDRLAFAITFWSAVDFPAPSNSNSRLFWGNCTSKSGNSLSFSSDYETVTRIDYRVSADNLWSQIRAGWNTWIISFGALAFEEDVKDINTFFMIMQRNASVADGDILYALSSLKLVRIAEEEPVKQIELRVNGDMIEWKYDTDTEWTALLPLSELKGADGKDGVDGKDGIDGADGITPSLRINSTTNEWEVSYDSGTTWTSLGILATGSNGTNGVDGINGKDGVNGENGSDGKDGSNGKDGTDGVNGKDGKDGKDGLTPFIGKNGNWWIGDTDTGVKAAADDGCGSVVSSALAVVMLTLAAPAAMILRKRED